MLELRKSVGIHINSSNVETTALDHKQIWGFESGELVERADRIVVIECWDVSELKKDEDGLGWD